LSACRAARNRSVRAIQLLVDPTHLLLQVARLLRRAEGVVELLLGLVQGAQKMLVGRRQVECGHLLLQVPGLVGCAGALVVRSGDGEHGRIRNAVVHATRSSKTPASADAPRPAPCRERPERGQYGPSRPIRTSPPRTWPASRRGATGSVADVQGQSRGTKAERSRTLTDIRAVARRSSRNTNRAGPARRNRRTARRSGCAARSGRRNKGPAAGRRPAAPCWAGTRCRASDSAAAAARRSCS